MHSNFMQYCYTVLIVCIALHSWVVLHGYPVNYMKLYYVKPLQLLYILRISYTVLLCAIECTISTFYSFVNMFLCQPVERDSNEATLTIVHVREHHFTTYTLKATNDIGSATYQLLLRKSASTSELRHSGRLVNQNNPQGPKRKPGYNQYSYFTRW